MRTMAKFTCELCGKKTEGRAAEVLSGRKRFCGMSCANSARAKQRHKTRPTCQTGENNGNWKGGISRNHYHYKLIQKQRYPERVRAREIVSTAIRRGKIVRGEFCEICGRTIKVQAHHEDYSKPLEIVWLCSKCHRLL